MIPANRIGYGAGGLSVAELKAIAEVVQILGFIGFQTFVLHQELLVNHIVGFLIVVVGFIMVLFGPFNQTVVHGLIRRTQQEMIELKNDRNASMHFSPILN